MGPDERWVGADDVAAHLGGFKRSQVDAGSRLGEGPTGANRRRPLDESPARKARATVSREPDPSAVRDEVRTGAS